MRDKAMRFVRSVPVPGLRAAADCAPTRSR